LVFLLCFVALVNAGAYTNLNQDNVLTIPTARFDHIGVYVPNVQVYYTTDLTTAVTESVYVVFGGRQAMNNSGYSQRSDILSSTEVYDFTTNVQVQYWTDWTAAGPYQVFQNAINPGPRYGHSAALVGQTIYIFGGATVYPNGTYALLNDMWGLDLVQFQWFQVSLPGTPIPPTTTAPTTAPTTAASTTAAPTTAAPTTAAPTTTNGTTSAPSTTAAPTTASPTTTAAPTTASTTAVPTYAAVVPKPRWNHCSVAIGTSIYVYGGYTLYNGFQITTDDFWVFNTVSRIWSQISSTTTVGGRTGHTCVTPDSDSILLFGGEDKFGSLSNQLWRFEISGVDVYSNQWEQLLTETSNQPPRARSEHTATMLYSSRLMFILGGYTGTAVNEVWFYDYYCNTWYEDTNNNNAMTARYAHSASKYTDTQIALYGGLASQSQAPFDTGYTYQINTNLVKSCFTAAPTSSSGADQIIVSIAMIFFAVITFLLF